MLVDFFQVFNPVVDDLDLLLHHGHSPGEVVMFPNLPGKLVQLGLRDRLAFAVGNQHAKQGDAARDQRGDDALNWYVLLADDEEIDK